MIKATLPQPATREQLTLPPDDWSMSISPGGIRFIWDGQVARRPDGEIITDLDLYDFLMDEKLPLDGWWLGAEMPWCYITDMPAHGGDFDERWQAVQDRFGQQINDKVRLCQIPMVSVGFHGPFGRWKEAAPKTGARGVVMHRRSAQYGDPKGMMFISFK